MDKIEFSRILLEWYAKYHRQMPWRGHPDPYAVWISEAMLQQTRVDTVIPYFHRWMERFPSIRALAQASEQDVLNAWEGLGYYSRARNLRKAATIIMRANLMVHLPQNSCKNWSPCPASGGTPLQPSPPLRLGRTKLCWMATSNGCWHGFSTWITPPIHLTVKKNSGCLARELVPAG